MHNLLKNNANVLTVMFSTLWDITRGKVKKAAITHMYMYEMYEMCL